MTVAAPNSAPRFTMGDGTATTQLGNDSYGSSVAVQADGKYLVAGTGNLAGDDATITRYNADGTLDTTFGVSGIAIVDFGETSNAQDIEILADGKILIGGRTSTGFALAQLNGDGTPDTNFGSNGQVVTDVGTSEFGREILIQSDGKIVLAGTVGINGIGGDTYFAVLRYNVDGSPDGNFGVGGIVTTDFPGLLESGNSAALTSDGKIVVAGRSYEGTGIEDFAIARYNADGSPDTTFGGDGKLVTDIGGGAEQATAVVVQPDGKIVVAGHDGADFAAIRYNVDGSLDNSFGTGGIFTIPDSGWQKVGSAHLLSNGQILVGGEDNGQAMIVRLNSDGTQDYSFGVNGIFKASGMGQVKDMLVQADGTIVIAGSHEYGDELYEFSAMRVTADGVLDSYFGQATPTFTQGGTPVVLNADVLIYDAELSSFPSDFGGGTLTIERVGGANANDVFGGSGTLTLGATEVFLNGVQKGTYTVSTPGQLEITFDAGATSTEVNQIMPQIAYENVGANPVSSVDILWTFDDGNTGEQGAGGNEIVTAKSTVLVLTDSTENTAPTFFNTADGIAVANYGNNGDEVGETIELASGQLLAVGQSDGQLRIARHNPDGSLDTSFNGTGYLVASVGDISYGYAVDEMADGRLVIAGQMTTSGVNEFLVARFNADGTLDETFNGDGIFTYDSASSLDRLNDVEVLADGTIFAVGTGGTGVGNEEILVMKILATGTLDTGFGGDGIVSRTPDVYSEGVALAVQADGKIVIAGSTHDGSDDWDFVLTRLESNGVVDSSFGSFGTSRVDIAVGRVDNLKAIELLPTGEIVAVGRSTDGSDRQTALIQLDADGDLDTGFGVGGIALDPILTFGEGLAVDGAGNIFVGGTNGFFTASDAAVAKFDSSGNVDGSFGSGGIVEVGVAIGADFGRHMFLKSDGNLVITGAQSASTHLIQMDGNGVLDPTFGADNSLGGAIAYSEGSTVPVALDINVSIFDEQLSTLEDFGGATLTLNRVGGVNTDDNFNRIDGGNLAFVTGNKFELSEVQKGSYQYSLGQLILTFDPGTTNADVNEVMQSIGYRNLVDDAPPASVDIQWTFSDGNTGDQGTGGSLDATGITTVNITAVNDKATVDLDVGDESGATGGDFSTTFIGSPVLIADSDAILIDPDSVTIYRMDVKITNLLDGTDESLSVDVSGYAGLSASYSSTFGSLVISGAGTIADYEAILRTIEYNNAAVIADSTTRIISVEVTDGGGFGPISNSYISFSNSSDGIVQGTAGDDVIDNTYVDPVDGEMVDNADGTGPGGNEDVIHAGAGNDNIVSGDEADTILGGSGDDVISTGGATYGLPNFVDMTGAAGTVTGTNGNSDSNFIVSSDGTLNTSGPNYYITSDTQPNENHVHSFSQPVTGGRLIVSDLGTPTYGSGFDLLVDGVGIGSLVESGDASIVFHGNGYFVNSIRIWGIGPGDNGATITIHKSFSTLSMAGGHQSSEAGRDTNYTVAINRNPAPTGDTVDGGDGADTILIADDFAHDAYAGGEGGSDLDSIDASANTTRLNVKFTGDEAGTISDGSNSAIFSEIEDFILTSGDDSFDASAVSTSVIVDAGAGADTIIGGGGDDDLTGGASNDTYVLSDGFGNDTIRDFVVGQDMLDVSALNDAGASPVDTDDVVVSEDGSGNAVLTFPNGETLILIGHAPSEFDSVAELAAIGIPPGFNDLPITDLNGSNDSGINFSTSFTEGDAAILVADADATISDPDNTTYDQLGINLGGFLDGNNETIRINGVVFNYDEALVTTTTVGGTTFEIDFDGSGFMIAENGGGVIPQVDLQALLRTISYQNPGDVPSSGDRTLTFIAIDSDGGVASPVAVSTITVVTVNNAPEIDNNAALQLTTITEDDIGNAGNTVAEILASDNAVPDPITDADGDPEGIAITSLSGGGTWQFDTGAGWTDIGTVSFTNALLLRDSDSIRYVPDGLNGELGGVVFQAWDQSTGGFGTKADTSNFGGTTAYSTHSDVALIMVTDVNDAPMLNNSGLNFLPSINEDAINTAGETVANFIASVGGDSITDVDPGSVEGIGIYNTDASNGTWEYSPDGGTNWIGFGTPSPTATLLLSADAMIRFEPDADFSGTPTFAFVAWDQTAGVEGGTLQLAGNTGANGTFSLAFDTGLIDVNPVNDVPTISNLDASVLEFTAGGAPVALTDGASLADIDSAIQTLIVRITNPVDGANEQLGFVHASTIGSNYDVSTGTLTLTNLGSAINGDFQVALESVSYENFSPTLNTTTRNITFVANDGLADSLEANVSVLMNGDVVAPTLLNNLTGSVDEGGAFNIAPEYLEFLDLQGAAEVTYTVTAVPVNGYLALKSNRAVPIVGFTQANIDANDVIYVHDGSETAADSFEFTVDDGQGNFTSTQQFSLDVNPINDEPVLTLTGMTVDEGSLNNAITSAMLSGFDVDDAPAGLTFRVISDVSDGSIVLNDGSGAIVLSVSDTFTQADIGNGYLSYSHDGSENATVLFDVELYDGGEDGVGSQFGTFTISINPINDAPDGVHVISQGNEGTAIGITLRGVDDDGTIASYNLGSLPANGTLYSDLQNGTVAVTGFDYPSNGNLIFHFVPDADFNGLTSFSFTVTDDLGLADDTPSTATIEVLAVNDAPVLNALITQDGVEDTPFTFSVANGNPIQVTDVDALGGSLKVDLNVNDGTLVLATTNGLTVVTGNGTGVVSFVGDINEINAALDGLIFQPNENFNGPVTVNVSVDDLGNTGSGGALVSNQVFNIDVASVNDAPTDIAPNAVTVPEDLDTSSGLIVATLSATDVDVGDTFSYAIMPGDDSARFSIVNDQIILSDGVLDYETKSSYVVTVEVTDSGGLSHQESLTINVEDSNEAPVATANIGSVDEGTVHLITNSMLQATDLEQTPSELNYSVLVSPTNGTLLRSGVVVDVGDTFTQADIDNNLLVYVHDGSESLSDGFQFSVDDGEGLSTGVQTANISINPINDAPVASDDAFVVDEDTVLVGSAVTANDSDAESNLLTVGLVSGPEHADSFTFNPDASFSYVPESNYFGTDSFVYLIDDGNGGTDTAIVTIQVSPVNDVPIAETDTFQLISGALNTIVLDVLANDIDIDGDALVAVLAVGPTNGTLTIDSDGQFVYTADPGFTGVDSFTYFASDSSGISVARGVQIAVIIPAVPVIPETTNPDLSPDSPSEFEEQTTLEEESETEEDQSELEEDHEKENLEGQLNALTSNIAPIADVAEDEGFKSEAQIKELLEIMTSQGEARVALQSILASTSVGQGEDLRKFEELDKLARSSNMKTVYDASFLWGQIDDQLKSTATFKPFSITVGAISAVGTVGYILWTLRGGALMALALTQLPSWRMIDPLPILDSYSKGGVNKVEDELGKFF